nr:hypothetical protein BdHM001_35120 [Bdellovibrio sp. HM001]
MKLGLIIAIILFMVCAQAQSSGGGPYYKLVKKDVELKLVGKSLSEAEKAEMDRLAKALGPLKAAQVTNQVMNEVSQKAIQDVIAPQSQSSNTPSPLMTKAPQKQQEAPQEELKQPVTVVINQIGPGAASTDPVKPEVQAPPKEPVDQGPKPIRPNISSETEKKLLAQYAKNHVVDGDKAEVAKTELAEKEAKPNKKLKYSPSPTGKGLKRPGIHVERDSANIVSITVGVEDAVTLQMCIAHGVSIHFDESIKSNIQRVNADDDKYFRFEKYDNNRGVYVRLVKEIPSGGMWESALRLIRKDDDKAYLVNLVGVPCPEGLIRFPKVVYLKNRMIRTDRLDDRLKLSDNEILTPQDTIIMMSKGYKETNEFNASVYDMVASGGASVVSMGVELETGLSHDDFEFKVLDYFQVHQIKTTSRYLDLQSQVITNLSKEGKKYKRFNLTVSVNKDYILRKRYLWLMVLNHKTKSYEYRIIDLIEYFKDLKDREFEL